MSILDIFWIYFILTSLIIHTPGGLVLAAQQIAHALGSHEAKVTVFVPHYAMS